MFIPERGLQIVEPGLSVRAEQDCKEKCGDTNTGLCHYFCALAGQEPKVRDGGGEGRRYNHLWPPPFLSHRQAR